MTKLVTDYETGKTFDVSDPRHPVEVKVVAPTPAPKPVPKSVPEPDAKKPPPIEAYAPFITKFAEKHTMSPKAAAGMIERFEKSDSIEMSASRLGEPSHKVKGSEVGEFANLTKEERRDLEAAAIVLRLKRSDIKPEWSDIPPGKVKADIIQRPVIAELLKEEDKSKRVGKRYVEFETSQGHVRFKVDASRFPRLSGGGNIRITPKRPRLRR